MAASWDQLPGETSEAYRRFLIYRNLGFKRTLLRAYRRYLQDHDGYTGGYKRLTIPGQWCEHSRQHFWRERCRAWDIHNLIEHGAKAAIDYAKAVSSVAEKAAASARKSKPGAEDWSDILNSLRVVREYLTPDVVHGIQEKYQPTEATTRKKPDRKSVE